MELADTTDLKSVELITHKGSTPLPGILFMNAKQRSEWIKELREQCKAKEICSYCYTRPVFKQKYKTKPTRIFSKCLRCLKRNAWFQAEYRDRQKTRSNYKTS